MKKKEEKSERDYRTANSPIIMRTVVQSNAKSMSTATVPSPSHLYGDQHVLNDVVQLVEAFGGWGFSDLQQRRFRGHRPS